MNLLSFHALIQVYIFVRMYLFHSTLSIFILFMFWSHPPLVSPSLLHQWRQTKAVVSRTLQIYSLLHSLYHAQRGAISSVGVQKRIFSHLRCVPRKTRLTKNTILLVGGFWDYIDEISMKSFLVVSPYVGHMKV